MLGSFSLEALVDSLFDHFFISIIEIIRPWSLVIPCHLLEQGVLVDVVVERGVGEHSLALVLLGVVVGDFLERGFR